MVKRRPFRDNGGMDAPLVRLAFDRDTLVLTGPEPLVAALPGCRLDPRVNQHRAEARCYRAIVEQLRRDKVSYQDDARGFQPTAWALRTTRDPFPHQKEALETWARLGSR